MWHFLELIIRGFLGVLWYPPLSIGQWLLSMDNVKVCLFVGWLLNVPATG